MNAALAALPAGPTSTGPHRAALQVRACRAQLVLEGVFAYLVLNLHQRIAVLYRFRFHVDKSTTPYICVVVRTCYTGALCGARQPCPRMPLSTPASMARSKAAPRKSCAASVSAPAMPSTSCCIRSSCATACPSTCAFRTRRPALRSTSSKLVAASGSLDQPPKSSTPSLANASAGAHEGTPALLAVQEGPQAHHPPRLRSRVARCRRRSTPRCEELPPSRRDHALKGEWKGHRECHVEPDWLLVYHATDDELLLARTGTHADLFGN